MLRYSPAATGDHQSLTIVDNLPRHFAVMHLRNNRLQICNIHWCLAQTQCVDCCLRESMCCHPKMQFRSTCESSIHRHFFPRLSATAPVIRSQATATFSSYAVLTEGWQVWQCGLPNEPVRKLNYLIEPAADATTNSDKQSSRWQHCTAPCATRNMHGDHTAGSSRLRRCRQRAADD